MQRFFNAAEWIAIFLGCCILAALSYHIEGGIIKRFLLEIKDCFLLLVGCALIPVFGFLAFIEKKINKKKEKK